MLAELLFQFVEFAVRTVILLGLLWVMIKLQRFNRKYEYRFLKLMAAAALAGGLGMIPHVGQLLAFPVLWVSVKKVTRADYVETLLTIGVSCALVFAGSRFLLKPLMSDLRTCVENVSVNEVIARLRPRKPAGPSTAINTNQQTLQTNPPALRPAAANPPGSQGRPAPVAVPSTNPPRPGAATNVVPPPAPRPAENVVKYISVKGVTRNGPNSAATIQAGTKVYTVFLKEATLMQTPAGPVSVRFAELGTNSVTLEINGEPAKFMVR